MTEPRQRNLPALRNKFRDFDKQDVYEEVVQQARDNPKAQNFVVLFGPHRAKVAVDLGPHDFKDLFLLKDLDCPVRWVNFWNTSQQGHAINIIGDKYGFTRRLRASIIKWDELRNINQAADARRKERERQLRDEKEQASTHVEKTDIEAGLNGETVKQEHIQAEVVGNVAPSASPNQMVMADFKVIQDSLNYTTTDYGARCKSVG
jgi:hypothetical protein